MHDAGAGILVAILLFLGTCCGLRMPVDACCDTYLDMVACLCPIAALVAWCMRRKGWPSFTVAMIVPLAAGFVVAGNEVQRSSPSDLVGAAAESPTLVRFRAVLMEEFRPPDPRGHDLLDRFQPDADDASWRAGARLLTLADGSGEHVVAGLVTLVVPDRVDGLRAGDEMIGTGWLRRPRGPRNPGEHDMAERAWRGRMVGTIRLESAPTLTTAAPWWSGLRSWLQTAIDHNLTRGMPCGDGDPVATLVVAMTSGRERVGYASLRESFATSGLSHFLAISGFNVAILFMAAAMAMEWIGVPTEPRPWLLVAVGLVFMAAVDVEVSVLRAGIAGVMSGISMATQRRWRADGLLGAAATGTLIVDPWMAWNPGFQLSYAAVLALRHGTGPVERVLAWMRVRPLRGVRKAMACSLAAWIVSTPITLTWFGSLHPWCPLASVVLGPLAASITVTASVTSVLGCVPVLDSCLGAALWAQGWAFMNLVDSVRLLPGATMAGPPMPWWWSVSALIAVTMWWSGRLRGPVCIVATLLPYIVSLSGLDRAESDDACLQDEGLTWTILAVGDGSAHLIQSDGHAMLFDAGSISMSRAGSGLVVPALEALGVRKLGAIVISHPHLDHLSAIPEVIDRIPTDRILVSDAWGDHEPESAVGTLMSHAGRRHVVVERIHEGFRLRQGDVTWTALHPPAGFRPRTVNDGSLCFRIDGPLDSAAPLLLLLGDAEDEAITRLLARKDLRHACGMELPHHGGWRPSAGELCRTMAPQHVLQSTDWRRFDRDRFTEVLQGCRRAVTCRDGAVRFRIDRSARQATLERWWRGGWRPLVP